MHEMADDCFAENKHTTKRTNTPTNRLECMQSRRAQLDKFVKMVVHAPSMPDQVASMLDAFLLVHEHAGVGLADAHGQRGGGLGPQPVGG